jgi:hypothetical protein
LTLISPPLLILPVPALPAAIISLIPPRHFFDAHAIADADASILMPLLPASTLLMPFAACPLPFDAVLFHYSIDISFHFSSFLFISLSLLPSSFISPLLHPIAMPIRLI